MHAAWALGHLQLALAVKDMCRCCMINHFVLHMQHVDQVLEKARASLGPEERTAMHQRYQSFRQSRQDSTVSPFSAEREAARRNLTKSMNAMKVAMA
jgi:hypothetical protein